jgi:hypothetical protein
MKKRIILISIISMLVILLAITAVWFLRPQYPAHEISEAVAAVSRARKAQARRFAPQEWYRALSMFESAQSRMAAENKRFFLLREYEVLATEFYACTRQAGQAEAAAITAASRQQESVGLRLKMTEQWIEKIRARYGILPLDSASRIDLARAGMLIREAGAAGTRGQWDRTSRELDRVDQILTRVSDRGDTLLHDYLASSDLWLTWVNDAIEWSRQTGKAVVIVDKLAGSCNVYRGDALLGRFDAEFGPDWIGDKQQRGDNRTPEGRYRVTARREAGATRYYKALDLNYPNEEDYSRFQRNKQNGTIPENADIGGMIEIHGYGGKGQNWTEGCVALRNEDMDSLFKWVPEGTPVVIVGTAVIMDFKLPAGE